jgi:hypothetical protein
MVVFHLVLPHGDRMSLSQNCFFFPSLSQTTVSLLKIVSFWSGRDESICVVMHMNMDAMLEISLYSYLYLKLAKMLYLSYYCLCLLFNKIGEESRTSSA